MFETSFKSWLQSKKLPGETVFNVAERILHPIQDFMTQKLSSVSEVSFFLQIKYIQSFFYSR